MLATGNRDKVRELEGLLAGTDVTTAPKGFNPDETGSTLVQNAGQKARALRPDAPADAYVMADDSGLFVHALDGRPGVYSARYAGAGATYADNNALLLRELGDGDHRAAAFGCVLYCITPDGDVLVSAGVLPGEITRQAAGARGFGYDPVFRPLTDDRTLAEMTRDEKAAISHRGRAARGMARLLGIA